MRQSRGVAWGTVSVAGLLVALVASAVESQIRDSELPVHDFTDLSKAWNLATRNGNPLPVEWINFATTALQRPQETGKSAGGITLIGGLSGSSSSTSSTPVAVLPIVSLSGSDALEAHRRSMGLQLFLTAVSRFQPNASTAETVTQDARMSLMQSLPGWTRATHVELLVTETVFFLEAASKHDKCLHLERLQEHATYLGWDPTSQAVGTGGAALSTVPAAWAAVEASAKAFYDSHIAGQPVLEMVCEISPSVSNAEVEEEVKKIIEDRMVARFQELASQVGSALDGPLSNLVDLEGQSAVNVPTKELFALGQTVTNTKSVVDEVRNDTAGLENGNSSWRAQAVRAEQTAKTESQNQVAGMEHLEAARAELAAAVEALRSTTSKLNEISSLPGLASELVACRQLVVSSDPTPAENEALIRGFDQCLGAIGDAYTRLRNQADQDPRAPAFRDFAAKVAGLSQKIADVYHLQMRPTG